MYAMGVRRSDILIHGTSLSLFVGGLPIKEAIERIGAAFVPIGTGASEKVVTAVQILKANAMHATPSYAIYLAEYVRSRFDLDPRELGIKKIVSGAEPGAGIPAIRQKIESEWGAKICEGLGNADMAPVIFGECHTQTGMHYCAQEYIIPEVIDPDTGEPLPIEKGVTGELVYTAIDRECVPLLRFRTRDRVEIYGDGCVCGRTSFRLRCIGRTDDMLIVLGVNVFPTAIRDVVAGLSPRTTGEIQVVIDKPGPKVEPPLKVVAEYGETESDLNQLREEIQFLLKSRLSIPTSVELVPPATLPRFEMKAQLVRKRYEEGKKT
jgi:phenylacetate-CoA ligase